MKTSDDGGPINPEEYLAMCKKHAPPEMLQDAEMFARMPQEEQNEFLYFLMMDCVNRMKFYERALERVRK